QCHERAARGEITALEADSLAVVEAVVLLVHHKNAAIPVRVAGRVQERERLEAPLGLGRRRGQIGGIAGCRIDRPRRLELPRQEYTIEGAENAAGVVDLPADACQYSQGFVEHFDRSEANPRCIAEVGAAGHEALVVAGAQTPQPVERLAAPTPEQI